MAGAAWLSTPGAAARAAASACIVGMGCSRVTAASGWTSLTPVLAASVAALAAVRPETVAKPAPSWDDVILPPRLATACANPAGTPRALHDNYIAPGARPRRDIELRSSWGF